MTARNLERSDTIQVVFYRDKGETRRIVTAVSVSLSQICL